MARVVAMILPGPYRIPAYAYDVKVYLTTKCPAGPMRAPMAAASWIMEGTIDAIARALGARSAGGAPRELDFCRRPAVRHGHGRDLRRRHAARDAWRRRSRPIDYDALRAQHARERAGGRLVGLGLCTVIESTTYGSAFYRKAGIPGSGHEVATVRVEPTGAVNVSCGLMGSGQGYETTLAQCAAEGLGARLDDIVRRARPHRHRAVRHGQPRRARRHRRRRRGAAGRAPPQRQGAGHRGGLLGLNASDGLEIANGEVMRFVGGAWEATGLTLADDRAHRASRSVAASRRHGAGAARHPRVRPAADDLRQRHPRLRGRDRPRTGALAVRRYLVAHDCGTEINPTIVAGQVHGAVAMGLSGALMEHAAYDADGQNQSGLVHGLRARARGRPAGDRDRAVAIARTASRRPASRAWRRAASWARSAPYRTRSPTRSASPPRSSRSLLNG